MNPMMMGMGGMGGYVSDSYGGDQWDGSTV